jgi:hypothetical protein
LFVLLSLLRLDAHFLTHLAILIAPLVCPDGLRRSAFDGTASRVPLVSNVLVIEFTQLALSAFAHRRLRVEGFSTARSAKTHPAIPSHHASFLLRVAILRSSLTQTATRLNLFAT